MIYNEPINSIFIVIIIMSRISIILSIIFKCIFSLFFSILYYWCRVNHREYPGDEVKNIQTASSAGSKTFILPIKGCLANDSKLHPTVKLQV